MKFVFWISIGVILYVYAGYALALTVFTWRSRPTKRSDSFLPKVSLIIAAYNEEKVLQEKLENCLALDYPRDRLEIVLASDGSTDATNRIAQSYANKGIALHKIMPRGGKTRALNLVIPRTEGEILVLSDANTMYRSDAIRKLVQHFVDPTVGAVSGDVRLVGAADSHAQSEGLYYRYERWLQKKESRIGSVIGADGGMYAVKRAYFRPPSNSIIVDDFVISMTVARLGYRVLYEPEAVAIEQGTLSSLVEFQRKSRVVAGGIQALKLGEGLPRFQQPLLMFCYISHKLLRWLAPIFLLFILLASVIHAYETFFLIALLSQIFFYGAAIGYKVAGIVPRRFKWSGIPYYFCLVNVASLVGIWKGLFDMQAATWRRTAR